MFNKKNLPLLVALAIPVVMIIAVALAIYLPGIGKHPKYNFLYMTGNGGYGYPGAEYMVSGGHLVRNDFSTLTPPRYPTPEFKNLPDNTRFYLYDIVKNSATEITFLDAQKYTLDPSNISPDGYVVERGNGGGGFPFGGGGDYNTWFIKGYNRSSKLNLKLTNQDYYNFQFLGWTE